MGQAIAHPPDTDSSPVAAGSADDLLSQLAEQEIDRMLADADAGLPPEPASAIPAPLAADPDAPAASEPPASADEPSHAGDLSQVAEQQIENDQSAIAQPETATVDADELAELLNKAGGTEADVADASAVPGPVAESVQSMIDEAETAIEDENIAAHDAAAATAEDQNEFALPVDDFLKELDNDKKPEPPDDAPAVLEQPTTAAERAALAPEDPRKLLGQLITRRGAPVIVRILEPLNKPFAAVPDAVRDTLGKIAILTTMNAMGILLYLFIFKR